MSGSDSAAAGATGPSAFPTDFFHVATADDWGKFTDEEDYYPSAYANEGFIHCCTEAQLAGVLSRYFKGAVGLRLLYIDSTRLLNELKWEKGGPTGDIFPHIYGPITRLAIVGMKVLPRQPDGSAADQPTQAASAAAAPAPAT